MNSGSIWEVFKAAIKNLGVNKIPKLGASLAYYTVFSMAPMLIVLISLAGIFLGQEAAEGEVYKQLSGFMGDDTAAQLEKMIRNASLAGKSNLAAIIGGVTLLVGATTIFAEIQDSINSIWGVKVRPKRNWLKMLRTRLLSFSVIISLGFLLLVSLAVSAIVDALGEALQSRFPGIAIPIFYVVNMGLTFIIATLIFGVIFKVLPDAVIRWKDVWAGSIGTAVLFMLGKFAISFYISRSNIGTTYGAAGFLIIFLVWVYYSSIVLYFGASFTKQYALARGFAIQPREYAVRTSGS
ncbi:MAG TPA: YihY/virulence factor BrkB family protein [Chitinophagaceae bacterium]|nr:YihY/virulence factor BrkB family protein [Chitinophagaceae bacterium]